VGLEGGLIRFGDISVGVDGGLLGLAINLSQ
jgi:hypothetical protein